MIVMIMIMTTVMMAMLEKIRMMRMMRTIQHTEDTKDVPSGRRGWHRPVALEYARLWNMQQPGSGTSWSYFMQCRSLDTTVGKS